MGALSTKVNDTDNAEYSHNVCVAANSRTGNNYFVKTSYMYIGSISYRSYDTRN